MNLNFQITCEVADVAEAKALKNRIMALLAGDSLANSKDMSVVGFVSDSDI